MRWEMALRSFSARACIDVQHKRIRVSAQLCHDEWRFVRHQAADEVDVTTQSVELGDDNRGLVFPAALSAAASCGRRSSASASLPVSTSWKVLSSEYPSGSASGQAPLPAILSPYPTDPVARCLRECMRWRFSWR